MLRNSILSLTMIGALAAAMFSSPNTDDDQRSIEPVQIPVLTLAQAPAEVKAQAPAEVKADQEASGESVLEKHSDAKADESPSDHDASHDHADHEHAHEDHSHDHGGEVVVMDSANIEGSVIVEDVPCCTCYTVCEARKVRVGLFKLRCRTRWVPVTVCDSCSVHMPTMVAPVTEAYGETVIESEILPPPALEETPTEEPTPAKPVEAVEEIEAVTQEA